MQILVTHTCVLPTIPTLQPNPALPTVTPTKANDHDS